MRPYYRRKADYGKDNELVEHICEIRSGVGREVMSIMDIDRKISWADRGDHRQVSWSHMWSDILVTASEVLNE